MTPRDVLAVVVSYDGGEGIRATIDALRGQVGSVLVVDNGSGAESLDVLDDVERRQGIRVIRLGENRGVGHALNLGVEEARRLGYAWLLTMDQDSVVGEAMICAYQSALAREPSLVCLAPEWSGAAGAPSRRDYAITSGNLVRVAVFDEVGPYDEGMFVDCVDFDFSLRLRTAGHRIANVPGARMMHCVGHPVAVPRWVRRLYTLHPPVRRYYMFRNYLYLAERHASRFPLFIAKLGALQLVLLVLIGLYDPHPLASYRAAWKGVRDYFLRQSGSAGELAG